MKLIQVLILTLICLSCQTQPQSFEGTQCSPVFAYVDIDGKSYIDIEMSICNCRGYKVSRDYIGKTTDSKPMPISKCNLINGYSPKEYSALYNLMELVRSQINNSDESLSYDKR